ncbi:M16 family metallopeptidase [Cellulomonas triticagri]|uniref:Insulinase family protein n=1 Tax=Cellulomonas triticagri TaxID=2483352 RepID=A0A3M2JKK5_9CELL|nr:insulinase family protein [Cellulomonas triticagri]RMI12746.1 insulinase family protein [Cellulomonas triticagri]
MAVASGTEHHETTRAGVLTRWTEIPGDVYGFLVFGLGQRDLAPRFAGAHHLVEHLVMRRVGPVATEHNAFSSSDSVVFHASGTADDVLGFLRRVGAAVRDLATVTQTEVDLERAAIMAEIGPDGVYASGDVLLPRFGPTGLGMVDIGHAALPALSTQDVLAFAASWFTTGNARLVLTTEPPADLDLGLPPGSAPGRVTQAAPLPVRTPAYVVGASDGVALSLLVGADPATRWLVADVLVEALRRHLRGARGLVYDVQLHAMRVDEDRVCWTVLTDPHDGSVDETALEAFAVVTDLAASGPDAGLLDHVRATALAEHRSVDGRVGRLLGAAELDLRGWSAAPEQALRDRIEAITGDEIAAVLRASVPSLLLCVPGRLGISEDTEARLVASGLTLHQPLATYDGMTPQEIQEDLLTDGFPGSGNGSLLRPAMSSHRGRRFSPWRKSEVLIGRHQIAVVDVGGRIRVEDVALLGRDDDGDVEVITRQGGVLFLNPANFRGAVEPWDRFVAGLPPEVVRHKSGYRGRPDEAG